MAEQALAETGAPSVDVIGYSAGGVVARLWVRDYGGAARARRVLTLGSPHHGTSQAALGRELAGGCPTACEQLVPDSDLLRRLNAGDETPDGPLWATVRSSGDQVVTPVDSAALDGAVNILVQDVCPGSTAQPRRRCPAIRSPWPPWRSVLGLPSRRGRRVAMRRRLLLSPRPRAATDSQSLMSLVLKLAQAASAKTSR